MLAVKTLETLELCGIRVACGVETGVQPIGSTTANGQTPAADLSLSRHPSHGASGSGRDTGPRYRHTEYLGAAATAERAGRPGCPSGVLASRSPAIPAGPAVRCGWPLAGEVGSTNSRSFGAFTNWTRKGGSQRLLPRLQRHSAQTLRPSAARGLKRRMPPVAWTRPRGETPTAATRGCRIFDC